MASKKNGIGNIGAGSNKDLGGALLKIIAYGVAGGALLISGAKKLGESLLDKQASDQDKLETERKAAIEEVRRIVQNDPAEQ